MKVASFTVHATAEQSRRWKIAADGEGFPSTGAWISCACDAYLKARARAGLPIPLEWRRGHFRVQLEGGEAKVSGYLSPPFGAFCGNEKGQSTYSGRHSFVLVYVPSRRVLATVRTYAQVKALGAELARLWVRGDGSEPSGDPRPALSRTFPA